ncbi:pilin N-terminal domain-containing protein [Streptococcus phocae]|uniref:pilin N-terminal domain-containing protein n=1 Tax=Streptococcus phocae TaxID=119224 RepID=UPI0006BBF0D2|nr:pilin N-terminal domain-containing protein [Streptococcus phocae]
MKTKLLNILAAALLVFGVLMPAFAVMARENEAKPATKTQTVTLHKIVMDKEKFNAKNQKGEEIFPGVEGFDGTKYIGRKLEDAVEGKEQKSTIKNFFGDSSKEISGAYFAWQKQDEYSGKWRYINYLGQMLEDKSNKEQEEYYKKHLHGMLTGNEGAKFNTGSLPEGKYRIVEVKEKSTYMGENGEILADSKAVPVEIELPIVNKKGIVKDAHVYPKNTEDKPEIAKGFGQNKDLMSEDGKTNIEGRAQYNNQTTFRATASIGQIIPYEVKTKVNAGTEYGKLVWKDSMTNGLTLESGSIIINAKYSEDLKQNLQMQADSDYKIVADDRGFTLYLTKEGLKKVTEVTKPKDAEGKSLNNGKDVEFTLTYSATVNGNAIVDVPEKNDIRLEYGNKPYVEQGPTAVTPQSEKLTVTKNWKPDNTILNDVVVTYILQKGDDKYAVTLSNDTKEQVFDLGAGVKFNATGGFNGVFTGLSQNDGLWQIYERVAGYNAEIKDPNNIGSITNQAIITNTKDKENPTPLHPTSPEVAVGGRRFVKTDYKDTGAKRLPGAVFFVKKGEQYLVAKDDSVKANSKKMLEETKKELDKKVADYNKLTSEEQKGTNGENIKKAINTAQKAYNDAFNQASLKYEWAEEKGEATEFISDGDGRFEVSGLAYGSYELEEKTAPVGYGKLSNNVKFEINKGSYKGYEKEMKYELVAEKAPDAHALQIKNRKITIPQTGGIGTVIFTVAGLAIMVGAGYVMVRRRNHDQA